MAKIPFLDPEKQEAFLRDHGMTNGAPLSHEDRQWLTTANFHFVMGYARHYRNLHNAGLIPHEKKFADIRGLIQDESDLACFLTPWIRKAEWNLRALTTKIYCSTQGHGEGFLDSSHWSVRNPRKLQISMCRDILRHGEPYVDDTIKKRAQDRGIEKPDWCDRANVDLVMELVQELPFWAVVDSFTIGTLGKFLRFCGNQPGGKPNRQRPRCRRSRSEQTPLQQSS